MIKILKPDSSLIIPGNEHHTCSSVRFSRHISDLIVEIIPAPNLIKASQKINSNIRVDLGIYNRGSANHVLDKPSNQYIELTEFLIEIRRFLALALLQQS